MLRLRPYKDEDAPIILSWCDKEKDFYKWTAGVMGEYPITEKEFTFVKGAMPFTAIDEDGPMGFFTLRKPHDSDDELRIGFVIVSPDKRGKGYGKEMLILGQKFAVELYGTKKVSLVVFDSNMPAYCCYKAAGFHEVACEEDDTFKILDEEWKRIVMEIDVNEDNIHNKVKQLSGANMDIDLTSNQSDIHWEQTMCPWNKEENTKEHKCAVKNTSICKYFCGIKYLDSVLCSYPYENLDV